MDWDKIKKCLRHFFIFMQQRDSIVCGLVYHLFHAEKDRIAVVGRVAVFRHVEAEHADVFRFKINIGGSDQSRRDMLLTVRTTAVEPVSPGE